MINDSELENCNINLKPKNSKTNRPNSRKRSAFKFIEENLENNTNENKPSDLGNNDLDVNSNINANNTNENINSNNPGFIREKNKNKINSNNKPKIISESNVNKFLHINNIEGNNSEKKIEYESRRKKPMNIINVIDNYPGTNSGISGVTDKNNFSNGKNSLKEFNSSTYESRRQINLQKNISSKDKDVENHSSNKNLSKI